MAEVPSRTNWRVAQPTAHPLPPSTDGLLEGGADAIPVRITIVQDDVTTGWDDGAMGFEEDAVWFSGRACSFHIGAQDILSGTYRLSRHEAVTDAEVLSQGIPLRYAKRKVWIRVQVLEVDGRENELDWRQLVTELKRLRALPGSPARSQYPPLTPRPDMLELKLQRRQSELLKLAGGACALYVLLDSTTGQPDAMSGLATAVAESIIFGILLLVAYSVCTAFWRHGFRVLERIREEERA